MRVGGWQWDGVVVVRFGWSEYGGYKWRLGIGKSG